MICFLEEVSSVVFLLCKVKSTSAKDHSPQEDYFNALPMSNKFMIQQAIGTLRLHCTGHSILIRNLCCSFRCFVEAKVICTGVKNAMEAVLCHKYIKFPLQDHE